MKKVLPFFLLMLIISSSNCIKAQVSDFEIYKKFRQEIKEADYNKVKSLYKQNIYVNFKNPQFTLDNLELYPRINKKFSLSKGEIDLLEKNNFVVLRKSNYPNFGTAIRNYYMEDIPIFITGDAILYAVHKSYDNILKTVEVENFLSDLKNLLTYFNFTPEADASEEVKTAYKDAQLYIYVAKDLLLNSTSNFNDPTYQKTYNTIFEQINSLTMQNMVLLPGLGERFYDFSQLKPRGHYTDENFPQLQRYFKSMMWLGRTELCLISPTGEYNQVKIKDLNRQIAAAYIIGKQIKKNVGLYNKINQFLDGFIGEQDNVQYQHIMEIADEIGINSVSDFFKNDNFNKFREALMQKPYKDQKILSQCLFDNCTDEAVKPASSFMIFGNRFIIDSYIFSNLVHDKVKLRMMPSTLDVLFAIGNNSAAEFLKADFSFKNYGENLASLRYLVDNYKDEFWNSSIYNSWLNSIRQLNPPAKIDDLPAYMKTPAWWQMKMNSQLASWAELRHDNLLYAKQSYTAIAGCSYPYAMVEPVPELFKTLSKMFENLSNTSQKIDLEFTGSYNKTAYYDFLKNFKSTMDRLSVIAAKELNNQPLDDSESKFLRQVYTIENGGCVEVPDGWYMHLFYSDEVGEFEPQKASYIVADVHTQPTDEVGNEVGHVLHVGTGDVNTMIIVHKGADGTDRIYAGPVYSYYELITKDFERLTDEEWLNLVSKNQNIARPFFTKLYMADEAGEQYINPASLQYSGINDDPNINANHTDVYVAPNPFVQNAKIYIKINAESEATKVTVSIYNNAGKLIRNLASAGISSGNYLVNWDGKDNNNIEVQSGVYLLSINVNGAEYTSKLIKK